MNQMRTYILLMFLCITGCSGNQKVVEGFILSRNTGDVIPYANVIIKKNGETIVGTNSNQTGRFRLEVPEKMDTLKLEISLIGYKTTDTLLITEKNIIGHFFLGEKINENDLIFNKKDAQNDINSGIVQVYTYGYQPFNIEKMNEIAKKYGFQYKVLTCEVDENILESVKTYNDVVSRYLDSINPGNWRNELTKELKNLPEN